MVLDESEFDLGYVPGARVSIPGLPAAITDANGHFLISGVTPGARVLVTVTKATDLGRFFSHTQTADVSYARTQVPVAVVAGETTYVYPRLVEGCFNVTDSDAGVVTVGPTDGICSQAPRPSEMTSVTLDLSNLSGGTGTFVGNVDVEVIPTSLELDLGGEGDAGPGASAFLGVPGDFLSPLADGGLLRLQAYGEGEIDLRDDATSGALVVGPGANASIQLDVTDGVQTASGLGLYAFDFDAGLWTASDGGLQLLDAPVVQLTLASLDRPVMVASPLGPTSCITGTVTTEGVIAAGLTLRAFGADHDAAYSARTDQTGSFCLEAMAGGHINLDVLAFAGGAPYRGFASIAMSATASSCAAPATCVNVGTVDLAQEAPICAAGQLFNNGITQSDGGPVLPLPDGGPAGPGPENRPEPFYIDLPVPVGDEEYGRYSRVYFGQVVPDPDATFCAAALPLASGYLVGPDPSCLNWPLPLNGSEAGGMCASDGGCQDLGTLEYFCGGGGS